MTEPQQPDLSLSVLDLVRQYGRHRADEGEECTCLEAAALLDRIAALIPQQPVQARSLGGLPLWHHGCGAIDDRAEQPGPFACSTLGCTAPWRPLLVGGDPAPERCATRSESGWRCPFPAGHDGMHTINFDEEPDPVPEPMYIPDSTIGPHRYERGPYAVDGSQVCGLFDEPGATL